jgi:hypothetical protein
MKAALLLLLALSALASAEPPELDMPGVCYDKQWPALDVMEALGFEVQPSGGVGATWILRHTYHTRDWRQVWGKVKRPAETSGGLLAVTTRLHPHVTELVFTSYVKDWRDMTGRCKISLLIDYSGWKETLFAEGRERFKSTGELETRILDLIRNQVEAKGLLEGKAR